MNVISQNLMNDQINLHLNDVLRNAGGVAVETGTASFATGF